MVALLTVTLEAAVVPNDMVAVELKPVPVTVTCVPPATGPVGGLIPVTVGGVWETAGLADPLGGSGRKARLAPTQSDLVLAVPVHVGKTTGPALGTALVAKSKALLVAVATPSEV